MGRREPGSLAQGWQEGSVLRVFCPLFPGPRRESGEVLTDPAVDLGHPVSAPPGGIPSVSLAACLSCSFCPRFLGGASLSEVSERALDHMWAAAPLDSDLPGPSHPPWSGAPSLAHHTRPGPEHPPWPITPALVQSILQEGASFSSPPSLISQTACSFLGQ